MKSMSGEAWSATASCPVAGTQLTHPATDSHTQASHHDNECKTLHNTSCMLQDGCLFQEKELGQSCMRRVEHGHMSCCASSLV